MSLYVGLISGTSMDGIDAALVDIKDNDIRVVDFITLPYSTKLANQLADAIQPDYRCSIHEFATLDINVGHEFSNAANELLSKTNTNPRDVAAIGSHGQTLRHSTDTSPPYSLQIGHGAVIANDTRIDTVCDFRNQDIAAGGQGAPLVPAFHQAIFGSEIDDRVIVNIGGISNITTLPKNPKEAILGFDTGPGNCMMDEWCLLHRDQPFDVDGDWAASGEIIPRLLETFLRDPFLKKQPPKSTGREYYNSEYLRRALKNADATKSAQEDVQATLLEFTIRSICIGLAISRMSPTEIIVCGGGAKNRALMARFRKRQPEVKVRDTNSYGFDSDAVESAAFAWFAYRRTNHIFTALPSSKSQTPLLLGSLFRNK